MKKYWICLLLLGYNLYFGQITDTKKTIDSISAQKWKQSLPDLDSIIENSIVGIKAKVKDTIYLKTNKVFAEQNHEIPVTPFQLIKYQEGKTWFFYGQNNMIFNQASFSNWNSGGNNNIGIIGKVNYNLSYKKRKHFLENTLQLSYGFVSTKGQSSRKTEDNINLTSNYAYDLGKNYYLSAGLQFISQFAPGYNYTDTPNPVYSNRISKFLAPAYVNIGLGISYNPSENFQIIVRPVNGKFTIVGDALLQKKGLYGLERDGQSIRQELGAMVNVLYSLKIYKDITLINKINFFSNYLFHAERVDITYNGTLNFRLNKFITTNITADLLYDHDQIKKLQVKQTLGIGFSYTLGAEVKEKPKKNIKFFNN